MHDIHCALSFYLVAISGYSALTSQLRFVVLWESNAATDVTGGGSQVVMWAMGSSCKYRRSFLHSPAAHDLLHWPVLGVGVPCSMKEKQFTDPTYTQGGGVLYPVWLIRLTSLCIGHHTWERTVNNGELGLPSGSSAPKFHVLPNKAYLQCNLLFSFPRQCLNGSIK